MALAQIFLTHGMADGKVGISIDDIVYSYHGNRDESILESKLNGSMKNEASEEDKATLIAWAKDGATREGWDLVEPIIEDNCVICHSSIPTLTSFETYEVSAMTAKSDEGASFESLTRVSHIHLFGISFIFMLLGYIYSMASSISEIFKSIIIIIPFSFLVVDIASWWITSIYPSFAWFTIIGGIGYFAAFAIMWFTSFYQMWFMKNK